MTVGEYRLFVEAGGYEAERFWQAGGFGKYKEPKEWEDQLAYPTRPVVGVCWYEACAYAVWSGATLPTEAWPGLRPQPNGLPDEEKVAEFAKIQPAHRRRRLNFLQIQLRGAIQPAPHKKPCQENKTLRVCNAVGARGTRFGRAQVPVG